MSIYGSIDDISVLLNDGVWKKFPRIRLALRSIHPSLRSFIPLFTPINKDGKVLLHDVLKKLQLLSKEGLNDSNENCLSEVIAQIENHMKDQSGDVKRMLGDIKDDLIVVRDGRAASERNTFEIQPPSPHALEIKNNYEALLKSPLLFRELVQGKIKELGNSLGECYGFAHSMCDSDLSPYKNKEKTKIEFNEAIYKYQQNQLNRRKDQLQIKKTRLTTKRFCPSLKKQAEALYQIASKHTGKDLSVILRSKAGGHATYLCLQEDQKIRYMDSNHGAFLFENKEQFISAYRLMYQYHNQRNPNMAYTFYAVNHLQEDKNNTLKESKTLTGKFRSLMTGSKYYTPSLLPAHETVISTIVGAGIGGAVGAVLGSFVPVFGTLIGGVVGAAVGSYFALDTIKQAHTNGHEGLLAPYHFLGQQLHELSEFVKEKLGLHRECNETPELVLPQSSSTASMLSGLSSCLDIEKLVVQLDSSAQLIAKSVMPQETKEPSVLLTSSKEVFEEPYPLKSFDI